MGRADFWQPGGWNMLCVVCGFKYKNTDMKLRWDNVWVCPEDWEPRQPQDFVRGVKDQMSVPYANPEPTPTFSGDIPVPTGEIVVGTPSVYINGVLTAAYTIQLPYGAISFTSPPASGAAIQWTGTWLHNSGAQQKFTTPFQFAIGDGATTNFNIYWSYI
jgi:hypothetical protein